MRTREKQVIVRLTQEEYNKLVTKSENVGLTISEFLRIYINGFEPREKPPIEFYEAIKQIRKVGNNINQIARVSNGTKYVQDKDLEYVKNKITEFILDFEKKVYSRGDGFDGNN